MRIYIARARLAAQRIAHPPAATLGEVVAHLGAVQAQDYNGGLWAVGSRTPGATEASVEAAVANRRIVRTWPMRGTLHFVAASDVRWMVRLLTPRVVRSTAARHRQLELDDSDFRRARTAVTKALEGGNRLTRDALYKRLHEAGISTKDARGLHILQQLAHEALICFGPREGKQQTLVLLDEWLPEVPMLKGEAAIAELTRRYFTGHGPATAQDLGWWSGLTQREIKIGLDAAGKQLASETIGGKTYWLAPRLKPAAPSRTAYLLPPWDEYTVGYRDRSDVVAPAYARQAQAGGLFYRLIVIDGRVVGTWKRTATKTGVSLTPSFFAPPSEAQRRAFAAAAKRYAQFVAG